MIDPGAEITLVNIEALDVEMAARVLNYCAAQMRFSEVLLVARERPKHAFAGTVMIDPLVEQIDVDHCLIGRVGPAIKTPYMLMVQNDGFIIGAHNFCREYLRYDYVAAPWLPDFPSHNRVGCGGFTLRSKRLMDAMWRHREEYPKSITAPHKGEDYWLSCTMEPTFREEGIKYAPLSVAMCWALEYAIPETPYTDAGKVGFHKMCTPEREAYKKLL